jgi:hypothetical protein
MRLGVDVPQFNCILTLNVTFLPTKRAMSTLKTLTTLKSHTGLPQLPVAVFNHTQLLNNEHHLNGMYFVYQRVNKFHYPARATLHFSRLSTFSKNYFEFDHFKTKCNS